MSWLLDGNLLLASVVNTHPHHQRAIAWLSVPNGTSFTCSVTEGTFLPLHMHFAVDRSAGAAWAAPREIQTDANHVFLDEGFRYLIISPRHIQGDKQVTDAWLAELARRHGARLATLDAGLVNTHPDVGFLIP